MMASANISVNIRLDTSALLEALDRYLEAVRPAQAVARKERALAGIRRKLEAAMALAFVKQGAAFLKGFAKFRSQFAEALRADDLDPLFSQADIDTLDAFVQPLDDFIGQAMVAGARAAIADLAFEGSFTLAHPEAVAYIKSRALEASNLINGTTKEGIKRILTQAVDEGWSYQRTAKAISTAYEGFAGKVPQQHLRNRAELIAVYETGEAYEAGNHAIGQRLQAAGLVMEKSWLTVGDGRVDPICRANQAQGWIPYDDAYASGHQHPQAHPACRCCGLQRRKPGADKIATATLTPRARAKSMSQTNKPSELDRLVPADVRSKAWQGDITSIDQLADIISDRLENRQGVFIRYASDIAGDIKRGTSKNYANGETLPGISVNNLWDESRIRGLKDRGYIAQQVADYSFLMQQGVKGTRPWVLSGRIVGRGSDNEPLVGSGARVIGRLTPDTLDKLKAIANERHALDDAVRRAARAGINKPEYQIALNNRDEFMKRMKGTNP
jgi:hypothetical protein